MHVLQQFPCSPKMNWNCKWSKTAGISWYWCRIYNCVLFLYMHIHKSTSWTIIYVCDMSSVMAVLDCCGLRCIIILFSLLLCKWIPSKKDVVSSRNPMLTLIAHVSSKLQEHLGIQFFWHNHYFASPWLTMIDHAHVNKVTYTCHPVNDLHEKVTWIHVVMTFTLA